MTAITIYHNPQCGTSRNVLALIRNTGVEPTVIHYLDTPPSPLELARLAAATGEPVRALVRSKEKIFDELQLADPKWSDDELLAFMHAHPHLINRPIVVTELGTRLCRPSETVLDILPLPQLGALAKEDGQALIDAAGRRV